MTKAQIRSLFNAGKLTDKEAEGWLALFGMSKVEADYFLLNLRNPPF